METEQGRVIQPEFPALALDPTLTPLRFLRRAAGGVFHKSEQALAGLNPTDDAPPTAPRLTQTASQSPTGAHVTCFLSRGLRPPSSPCAAGGGTGPSSPQGDRTVGRGCVAHLTGLRGHAGLDFLHFPFPPPTGMACKPQGRMDPEEQSCLFFLFFFFK